MNTMGFIRHISAVLCVATSSLGFVCALSAQEEVQRADGATLTSALVVPQQVRYTGKMATRAGDTVEAAFRVYAAAEGGDPLWTETQRITIAEDGSYSVLLGGASLSGLPQTVFAAGAARWLGVSVERGAEQERALLSSVPYAMKSADAESLAGHSASDFVTQEQFAQLAQLTTQSGRQGVAAAEITPLASGTVTGSGTDGTIPLWTGTLTQGNSEITQAGSDIGINEDTPAATLDVGGTSMFRGTATLPAEATATVSVGYRSQLLDFTDSAWSMTTNGPVAQTWRLYATDSGNDSANPTSSFNFQFQNGAGAPTPTILSIAQTGVISFAPTQTFPGTITTVTAASPLAASTISGGVNVTLNQSALVTDIAPAITTAITPALNNNYAQLNVENTFTGDQQFFNTGVFVSTAPVDGNDSLTVINTGQAKDANAIFAASYSSNAPVYVDGNESGVSIAAYGSASTGAIGVLGGFDDISSTTFQEDNGTRGYSAGLWADDPRAFATAALFATADSSNAAIFENASATAPTIYVANLTTSGPTGDAVLLRAEGAGGLCSINQRGSMACTGQLKNLVTTRDARQVETYSVQSAENWLEDYGGGQLHNGSATIALDPEFASTVNTGVEFHVFLTPKGDCEGLYVTNQTPNSFEVHELRKGQSNVAFDYKIVAKRSGHEAERLVDVTDRMKLEAADSHFKPRPDGPPANPNHPGISRALRKLPPQLALKPRP